VLSDAQQINEAMQAVPERLSNLPRLRGKAAKIAKWPGTDVIG